MGRGRSSVRWNNQGTCHSWKLRSSCICAILGVILYWYVAIFCDRPDPCLKSVGTWCAQAHNQGVCNDAGGVTHPPPKSGVDPCMGRSGPGPHFWQLNHANSAYSGAISANFFPNFDTRPPLLANPGSGPENQPISANQVKTNFKIQKCRLYIASPKLIFPFSELHVYYF